MKSLFSGERSLKEPNLTEAVSRQKIIVGLEVWQTLCLKIIAFNFLGPKICRWVSMNIHNFREWSKAPKNSVSSNCLQKKRSTWTNSLTLLISLQGNKKNTLKMFSSSSRCSIWYVRRVFISVFITCQKIDT